MSPAQCLHMLTDDSIPAVKIIASLPENVMILNEVLSCLQLINGDQNLIKASIAGIPSLLF